jgi:hypothetical protein
MVNDKILNFRKFSVAFCCILILFLFCSGCGTIRRIKYPVRHTYFPVFDSKNYGITKTFPKSFTIYPFKNTTWYETSAGRAREAAFQAFSLIGPCASMQETDKMASRIYTPSDAMRVARKQGTDAFVIGEAIYQDHVWLLILAYSYVEVKLSVYSTETGRLLWTGSTSSTSSEVGVSIILTPILTMIEHGLWSRKTAGLYYSANMDVIHDMRPDVLAVK